MLARIVFPWRFLVMLSSRTLAFLLAWSILQSSLGFSQTDKSRSSPVVTYSGTETGLFTIIFGGEQIGQEKFSITQDSTGYRATAEIRLTLEREKEKAVFVLKPVLTFNKFFEPSRYQVTQEDGLTKRSVRVIFKPDKSERIYEAGSEHDTREIALKSDVSILDDNAFHHYIILAKRFDFTKGGIQEFSAFVPQQFLAGSISKFKNLHPLLDLDKPKSYGPLILTDLYHEYKRAQHEVMLKVKNVVLDVAKDFEKLSGRKYGLFESYRLEDADIALVILNSAAGTSKDVVDEFRDKGIKAGLLKPRLFRPFPYEEMAEALKNTKAVCVMDRADSFGGYGPLFMDVSSALYHLEKNPALINKIYGLGGRDYLPSHAELVLNELNEIAKGGRIKIYKEYIGVRE